MSESMFRIQIVNKDTKEVVLEWCAGTPIETELVVDLANRVVKKGVGIGRTEKYVRNGVIEAFQELLYDLKKRV